MTLVYVQRWQRFDAIIRFYQSNLAFLTATNKELKNIGYIWQRTGAGSTAYIKGNYSKGECGHTLSFYAEAVDKVAAELAPYTVTKTQHIQVLLEMLNQPHAVRSKYLDRMNSLNSNPQNVCV